MDADLSTAATTEKSHTNATSEPEAHEVKPTSSFSDGAAEQGLTITNNELTLMGTVSLRMLSLTEEQGEPIQEDLPTDSSTIAAMGTQPHDNTRELPETDVARIEQLPDGTSESAQLKSGYYSAEEDLYRGWAELNIEQWERLRTALCVESSLAFPISLQVSGVLCTSQDRGSPATWFEDLIEDIDSLATFVKEGSQAEPVANFPPISTVGVIPGSAELFVWDLFDTILGFSTTHEHPESLKLYIKETFYSPVQSPPERFSITLADILDAGLEVEATIYSDEYLKVIKNKVKILTPQSASDKLDGYANNKIAVAFGIQTLGAEIYASLYVLYGLSGHIYDSNLLRKAQSLDLMPAAIDGLRMIIGLMDHRHARLNVLSSRVASLQKEIKYRRSWWPSLKRDMERNRREQPYFFWGALLAVFFGTSTIIQTVVSIVSCYYAIITYRATVQP